MDKMKITIEKLGALSNGDIELKPLTIFIGPNNCGKTWTAYAISAIFGEVGFRNYSNAYASNYLEERYIELEDVVNKVLNEGNSKIDIGAFFEKYYCDYINNVAKLSHVWFNNYMASKRMLYNFSIKINFKEQPTEYKQKICSKKFKSKLAVGENNEGLLNIHKDSDDPIMYFYTNESNIKEKLPIEVIRKFIIGNVLMFVHKAFFNDTFILPAERTGGVALLTAIRTKKSEKPMVKERDGSNEDDGEGVLVSNPVGEMFEFIENVKSSSYRERYEKRVNNAQLKPYIDLSKILLTDVLNGNIEFSEPESDGTSDILYNYDNKIVVDMPITSSSVKDLSVLSLYLQYLVQPNDLLVIDEPEINLHPEAQVKLIEFIAMLVNSKLNVVITTHSPYFVDHLVNLMKAYKNDNREAIKDKFYLKKTSAFISQNDVAIYLFDKNTCKDILKPDGFIDWETFSKIGENIANLYYEI